MSTEVLGPLANPTYKEYTLDIHRSGEHLLNLINEILDLRVSKRQVRAQRGCGKPAEIVEDCIGMVQLVRAART